MKNTWRACRAFCVPGKSAHQVCCLQVHHAYRCWVCGSVTSQGWGGIPPGLGLLPCHPLPHACLASQHVCNQRILAAGALCLSVLALWWRTSRAGASVKTFTVLCLSFTQACLQPTYFSHENTSAPLIICLQVHHAHWCWLCGGVPPGLGLQPCSQVPHARH
jgi:hypothetical protein